MKNSRVVMLVTGALVLGLTLGGLGIATAGTGTTSPTAASMPQTMMGTSSPVVTLANMTGLSVQEINALRAEGKSLATIATENGVDPAAVVEQTVTARKTYLDSLVAAVTITPAQEQTILATITARVTAMMNAVPSNQTTAPTSTAKKQNAVRKAAPRSKAKAHRSTTSHRGCRHDSSYAGAVKTAGRTSTRSTGGTRRGSTSTRHGDCWGNNYSGGNGSCGW